MSKSPDRKRLTELGSPPIPINALWIAKGDCFDISLFEKDNIKNLVLAAIPLTRRRIPFDSQRTSLAGLALESATSSGLGRAPLCNAGPHPGTTWNYKTGGIIHQLIEQPGHAG
ncbi:hypothetical protein TNCV_379631 [Trichonephila clavipes]|nr:hypothetical protein TNCV_379631 [Trichonephila clavipes]